VLAAVFVKTESRKSRKGGLLNVATVHSLFLTPPTRLERKSSGMNSRAKHTLLDAAIVFLVLLAYLPAFHAGFIWDDDHHLTHNPNIVGTGGLRGIWTSSAATYYPLALTSFWLQHALWGLRPLPYHLVNVLMHAVCAILLRRVLLQLNAGSATAWLGAVLWALHPVQTESVAWITELKNTQSGLFYLLAVLLFLKWRSRPGKLLYLSFLLCSVLALLSKTSTVMLPVVLVLCGWWLDRGWKWQTLKSLAPLFLISAAGGFWTIWEQKFHSGAVGAEWAQTLRERVAVAGDSVWFYLSKIAWPHPLIFLYPRWGIDTHVVWSFLPTALAVAALFLLWRFREKMRPAFFGLAYFVVSLFPVLDFFDVYFFRYSFVGDHFQYLATIGPLALTGGAIVWVTERWRAEMRWLVYGSLIVLLGVLTAAHTTIFRDDETLWRDTIAKNPDAWLAYNNLAAIYLDRGDTASATAELEAALNVRPHYTEAQANLGNILFDAGRYDEAINHFEVALQGDPNYRRIQDSLGVSLMMSGRIDEGIEHIRRALEIDPNDSTAHDNLAIAFRRKGNMDEAMVEFKEAVRVNPNGIQPRMRYGAALLSQEKYREAESQFVEALRISPDLADAHKFLGTALLELGRKDEAIHHLQDAARLDPSDEESKQKLSEIRAVVAKSQR
jgi:tetratricopeptide (TPR) repeat protein